MSSSPSGRRRSRREFNRPGAEEEHNNNGFFNDSINSNNASNNVPPMAAAIPISGKSTPQEILKASRQMQQQQMNNINNMRGIGSMNVLPITPENNEEVIKWPKNLINKVVESMDRKIDKRAGEKYLGNLGWSKGLMNCLFKSCDKIPIRFYIVDDSGSMNQSDGQRILGVGKDQKLVNGSRWSELMDCIYFAADLAEEIGAPTEFRLLNGSDPVMVGLKDDNAEGLAFLKEVCSEDPAGQTPLCYHVRGVVDAIRTIEDSLRKKGQRAAVIICSDGESTDGDVASALKPLEDLPALAVVRLCTNDKPVCDYWDGIDRKLELEMDVIADITEEATQVYQYNPWLTFSLPMHRMREFGASSKDMDLIDERLLSPEQMLSVVSVVLMDGNKNTLPHPEVSWPSFKAAVLNSTAADVFDPRMKVVCRPVNLQKLQNDYGPNKGSSACNIS